MDRTGTLQIATGQAVVAHHPPQVQPCRQQSRLVLELEPRITMFSDNHHS